ncbi:MAG: acetate kinase [Clostridiales bacterium]|nr:acetate kinase [Candidatus Coliplasma equi]
MFVLVVNAGSSSLKYQLFDMDKQEMIAKGLCERIGIDGKLTHTVVGKEKVFKDIPMPTHAEAVAALVDSLTDKEIGCIEDMSAISAVGHRVVSGGPWLIDSCLIDSPDGKVLSDLRKCVEFAPLHTKAHLLGIDGCMKIMPGVPQVLVMDTAFHQTMPDYAYTYPIKYEVAEKYAIRRYGAHGTSHRYVSAKALEILGNRDAKIVTCHLGNGSSISAVNGGKCVDTSMGLTPLEGIIMGSRCGSIDPAVVPFVMEREGISVDEMGDWMNKECGLKGVSGISSDLREVMKAMDEGNDRARLAVDILVYGIKKYIGAYAAAMNGVDCIVFTAGIGENDKRIRARVLENMEYLGVKLDKEANEKKDPFEISAPDSKVRCFVIPTNEELVIATDTLALAAK